MVGEVLLVQLGVVAVRGRPREVTCVFNRQFIAELVKETGLNVAPLTGGLGAFAAREGEVVGSTVGHGHVHDHLFTACWMGHGHRVVAHGIGFENVRHDGRHAAVGSSVGQDLTGDEVAVLVIHVGLKGQCLISGDGGGHGCHEELNRRTRSDGHVLRAAHQTEAGRHRVGASQGRRVETVRTDASCAGRPGDGGALDHVEMVVDGVLEQLC